MLAANLFQYRLDRIGHSVSLKPFLPMIWIGGFALVNLLYIAFACPYDLAPDEAHYWEWSRHLDYCYYSKGPLVAWLIRLSCELFGNTAFAVRLPAVISGAALLAGMYRLSGRSPWLLPAALCVPAFSAVSVLMTIDPPCLACWAWAAVFTLKAMNGSGRSWIAAGVFVAIGTLAKPTMLLFPVCVAAMRLFESGAQLRTLPYGSLRSFFAFLLISALGFLPMLIWNLAHDGLGFRHALGHAGANEKAPGLLGPLGFLGGQIGLLLGLGFYAFVRAAWSNRNTTDPSTKLLWWLSVPIVVFFLLFSVRAVGQPNWAAVAYVTGFPLAIAWLVRNIHIRGMKTTVAIVAVIGLGLNFYLRFPNVARPALAQLVPNPTPLKPAPVRQLDPTARLSGWKALAAEVDEVRTKVRTETGRASKLAAMTWSIPGALAFYCDGKPEVYSFGIALADRFSQFEVWRPNPVLDAQAFEGDTFVYVGAALPEGTFDRMELVKVGTYREAGVPLQTWEIWVCTGFRGFAVRPEPPRY